MLASGDGVAEAMLFVSNLLAIIYLFSIRFYGILCSIGFKFYIYQLISFPLLLFNIAPSSNSLSSVFE